MKNIKYYKISVDVKYKVLVKIFEIFEREAMSWFLMNKKKEGEKRSTEIKRQFLRAVSNWAFHEDLDDDVGDDGEVGGDVDGLVLVRYFHSLSSFHLFNSFIGVEITNIYSI